MIAKTTGLAYGDLVISFGDAHIYTNHFDQVEEQLSRVPFAAPLMEITRHGSVDDYRRDDFRLIDYVAHPPISAKVAV
jgi:thymidylate synthase